MDLLVQIGLFFILGLALFWFDSWAGVGLYRGWYNMTNREPLPSGERRGFLLHRPARVRIGWALALAAIVTALTLRYGSFFQDSTRVVLNLLAMLVGLGIGLLSAPSILRRLPGVVDTASDYLDEVEAGERDPKEDLGDALRKGGEKAIDKVRQVATKPDAEPVKGKLKKPKTEPPVPPLKAKPSGEAHSKPGAEDPAAEKPDADKRTDWRSGVDDYLKK